MDNFFKKIKVGVLNDHFDQLGGGTVHSFKLVEYLKAFYDCDVYIPGTPKTTDWLKTMLHLDVKGVSFHKYTKGIGKKYDYMFLNISHWKAEETNAMKKFMLVFFPQFFFPVYDYEFLANSEYTKQNIIDRWKQDEEEIHVIYPPIMTKQFQPSVVKRNQIIHVSRLAAPRPEADKGHRQMIAAFRALCDAGLKGWTFHIVGQVQDPNYVQELKQHARDYPIAFHEGIPFPQLQKLYAESKIYWHMTGITMPHEPGAQEHFGMTTVEAMSSGCVPITLNSGGQPEVVEDGKSGYLVNNIAEMVSRTMALTENPKKLKEMAVKARSKSKQFDEKEVRKKFFSVISRTDKVSIIIPTWNNGKHAKKCVDRLYKVTPPGFELILIDDASSDNSKKVLKALEKKYSALGHDIKCVFNTDNLGFAGSNNAGLKQATREYILYLNNDTLPQWGWLERMVDVFENKEDAGIVGARLYFPQKKDGSWEIQHAGIEFNGDKEPKHIGRYKKNHLVNTIGIQEVGAVTGACLMVKKEFAEFNEKYIRGYYEDIDMCLKVREKGYKVYINHEAKVIHYEGKTQSVLKKQNSGEFKKITLANKTLFHRLWDNKIMKLPKISRGLDMAGVASVKHIEVGGGTNPLYPKYAQVDIRKLPGVKYNNDARALPFPSNSLSTVAACYMLPCLNKHEAESALREWFRVLRPGGRLEIHVPDMEQVTRSLLGAYDEEVLEEIYGSQDDTLSSFSYGWNFQSLERLLSRINFVRLGMVKKPKNRPLSLSLEIFKPL